MSKVAEALTIILDEYSGANLGTAETDICVGLRESPKEGIFLWEYDSEAGHLEPANNFITEDEFRLIQVRVRGEPDNTGALETKARHAYKALGGYKQVKNGLNLYRLEPVQPPKLFEPSKSDDRNLVNYVFNVRVHLEKY